ncbi:MAG: GlsB/YeaQ/YmgE family stress response membrane protein [Alphaproteobacteria bacterium]|nr:GlsB/YeaQ/YmgE family stress response membrane protein [Alphaproteobacteria bacterium]
MEQILAFALSPWGIMIINGLIAGWLAGLLLGGGGLIRNLFVGVIGAILGGALVQSGLLNLPFDIGAWGNQIVVSTIGAVIVVIIARIIAR